MKEGKSEFAEYLISKMGMNDAHVAETANVPINFVKKIRVELN